MDKIAQKVRIIKYGTNVLTRLNSSGRECIDFNVINDHAVLINNLNEPVILITSGAVGFGRTLNMLNYIKNPILRKRALASMGNIRLFSTWDQSISDKNLLQALVTHRDLKNITSRKNIQNLIKEVYAQPGCIIVFNENDFVSDEELVEARGGEFGDNDRVAALIAGLCSDIFSEVELIINTSSDGVYDCCGKTIREIKASRLRESEICELCGDEKTSLGTGGMKEKLKIIAELVKNNQKIVCHLINGKKVSNLASVIDQKPIGTRVVY